MASTFTISGTATATLDDVRAAGDLTQNVTLVGGNYMATNQTLTDGAWTPLLTSSLSDLRFAFFSNYDISSSVSVATGSTGGNTICVLNPYDIALIPWSGSASVPLFAKSIHSVDGTTRFEYILVEK